MVLELGSRISMLWLGCEDVDADRKRMCREEVAGSVRAALKERNSGSWVSLG